MPKSKAGFIEGPGEPKVSISASLVQQGRRDILNVDLAIPWSIEIELETEATDIVNLTSVWEVRLIVVMEAFEGIREYFKSTEIRLFDQSHLTRVGPIVFEFAANEIPDPGLYEAILVYHMKGTGTQGYVDNLVVFGIQEDLAEQSAFPPTGPVTTKLKWDAISAEEFERLLFNLISDAEEYVNPQWLMQTNASDRGRDLSVERIITDALSGTQHQRVIIQAKHWTKTSVRPTDVTDTLTEISLWEPPVIQSLIIATSGWFTADAVAFIERHNNDGKRPQIKMWPESHLELLLARRPHLVSGFKLRP